MNIIKNVKKVTLGILGTAILASGLWACSDNNDDSRIEKLDNQEKNNSLNSINSVADTNYNTEENKETILKFASDLNNIEMFARSDFFRIAIEELENSGVDFNDPYKMIEYYKNCNTCDDEYKEHIIPLMYLLLDTSDNTLLEVVNSYENEFNKKTTDTVVKNNINFILFSMKQGIINSSLLYDNNRSFGYQAKGGGFWDCMGKTGGKAIGRGMVTGMIGGCITGAKIGATGGTIALPGIGTITGGVGGCIFGGASAAVGGAITGGIWAAVDCF